MPIETPVSLLGLRRWLFLLHNFENGRCICNVKVRTKYYSSLTRRARRRLIWALKHGRITGPRSTIVNAPGVRPCVACDFSPLVAVFGVFLFAGCMFKTLSE